MIGLLLCELKMNQQLQTHKPMNLYILPYIICWLPYLERYTDNQEDSKISNLMPNFKKMHQKHYWSDKILAFVASIHWLSLCACWYNFHWIRPYITDYQHVILLVFPYNCWFNGLRTCSNWSGWKLCQCKSCLEKLFTMEMFTIFSGSNSARYLSTWAVPLKSTGWLTCLTHLSTSLNQGLDLYINSCTPKVSVIHLFLVL